MKYNLDMLMQLAYNNQMVYNKDISDFVTEAAKDIREERKNEILSIMKKAKCANMKKWGQNANHNVLYIGGLSGSGKSTLASLISNISNHQTNVIHIDSYFDDPNIIRSNKDSEFNKFLKSKNIRIPSTVPKEKWDSMHLLDMFENAIEDFGQKQFLCDRKVIAEGIQIIDGGVRADKHFYADKPIIILMTSINKSMKRAFARDGKSINNKNNIKAYKDQAITLQDNIKEMLRAVPFGTDCSWVNQIAAD